MLFLVKLTTYCIDNPYFVCNLNWICNWFCIQQSANQMIHWILQLSLFVWDWLCKIEQLANEHLRDVYPIQTNPGTNEKGQGLYLRGYVCNLSCNSCCKGLWSDPSDWWKLVIFGHICRSAFDLSVEQMGNGELGAHQFRVPTLPPSLAFPSVEYDDLCRTCSPL